MPTARVTQEELAGSFVSDVDPPTFAQPTHHPVVKTTTGTTESRKTQLFFSSKVEALLFVNEGKLYSLFHPRIAYDHVSDPDETHPLVVGPLGAFCNAAVPVSISLPSLLRDAFVLVPKLDHFITCFDHGDIVPEALFASATHADAPFPSITDGEPCIILRLPLSLPKVTGEPIIEGSIHNEDVISALMNYHPLVHAWIEIQALLHQDKAFILPDSLIPALEASLLPENIHEIPVSDTPNVPYQALIDGTHDPSSLRNSVVRVINNRISENLTKFRKDNPSQPDSPPLAVQHAPPLMDDTAPTTLPSVPDNLSIQGVVIPKKHERALHTFRILLSSFDEETQTIVLPQLRPEFLAAFSQSSSQENIRYATTAMLEHDLERSSTTRDYLLRLVSDMPWNQATMTLFLHGMFNTTPLDESKDSLKQTVSFYTFLPPPPEHSSTELQAYLRATHTEHTQVVIGESNENRQKLSLKTFQGGLRNTITDILTGIANLESRLAFIVDYDSTPTKPLLVQWLTQLAHLFSSSEFRKFWGKYIETHPWLASTMATQIHVLFALTAKTSSNIKNIFMAKTASSLALSSFKLPIKAFESLVDDIQAVCAGTGPGTYATPPLSYVHPTEASTGAKKRKLEFQTQSSASRDNRSSYMGSPADKGWLKVSGRFLWPKDLSGKQLCNRFAVVGSSCPNGYNCPFVHKLFPKDFDEKDLQIICKFVDNEANVSFAPGIKVPPQRNTSYKSSKPTYTSSPSGQDKRKNVSFSQPKSSTSTSSTATSA